VCSTFCSHYLTRFTEPQLAMYDDLINKPSDEWDIFYWATGGHISLLTKLTDAFAAYLLWLLW